MATLLFHTLHFDTHEAPHCMKMNQKMMKNTLKREKKNERKTKTI